MAFNKLQGLGATCLSAPPPAVTAPATGEMNGAGSEVDDQPQSLDWLIDPEMFRQISELVSKACGGRSAVEVSTQCHGKGAALSSFASILFTLASHCFFVNPGQVVQLSVQQEGDADMELESVRREALGKAKQTAVAAPAQSAPRAPAETQASTGDPSGLPPRPPPRTDEGGAGLSATLSDVTLGNEEEDEDQPQGKKQSKKGQRKSKGAKRREREEAAERAKRKEEADARTAARQTEKAQRADHSNQANATSGTETPAAAAGGATSAAGAAGGKARSCNTCGGSFADLAAYRDHFKSDWHHYNQKLKQRHVPPISEQEFLLVDADELFFSSST